MVPVGIAHVGCTTFEAVGAIGKVGIAFTVAKGPLVIQVLSNTFLTLKAYPPGARPGKVGDVWNPEPIPYCTPVCVAIVMVPDGKAQVGCTMLPKVGAVGRLGTGFTVTLAPEVTQVMSELLRTLRV
jgi:hypothetical protein